MRSLSFFVARPSTPISAIQLKPVVTPMLKEPDPDRKPIHHVHCVECKNKMLPAMTRVFYCMGCKVTISNECSVVGPLFLAATLGTSRYAVNTSSAE